MLSFFCFSFSTSITCKWVDLLATRHEFCVRRTNFPCGSVLCGFSWSFKGPTQPPMPTPLPKTYRPYDQGFFTTMKPYSPKNERLEPENHQFEKENHLNQTFIFGFQNVHFRFVCISRDRFWGGMAMPPVHVFSCSKKKRLARSIPHSLLSRRSEPKVP